jgi:hypothetical protein
LAQDTPLYKNLPVVDMIYLARGLNRRFDQPYARARLEVPGIPPKRKAAHAGRSCQTGSSAPPGTALGTVQTDDSHVLRLSDLQAGRPGGLRQPVP